MKVQLMDMTQNPVEKLATIASVCYGRKLTSNRDEQVKLIKKIMNKGHHSVLEHVYMTFFISEISRVCSHQLVRHRIASYTQKSDRYSEPTKEYYIPDSSYLEISEQMRDYHDRLTNDYLLMVEGYYNYLIQLGVKKEDARYFLPQALTTELYVTMNLREIIHFLTLRLCKRAQKEIREVAKEILKICQEQIPELFNNFSPCAECKEQCDN